MAPQQIEELVSHFEEAVPPRKAVTAQNKASGKNSVAVYKFRARATHY